MLQPFKGWRELPKLSIATTRSPKLEPLVTFATARFDYA